jgi:hypothetical protein
LRRPSPGILAALSLLLMAATAGLWALGGTGRLSCGGQWPANRIRAAITGGAVIVEWWRPDPTIGAPPGPLLAPATDTVPPPPHDKGDAEIRIAGFAWERTTDFIDQVRFQQLALPLWPLLLVGTIAPLRWLHARRRTPSPERHADQSDDPLGGPVVRIGVLVALAIAVAFFAFSHFTAFLLIAIGLIVLGSGAESLGLSRAARAEARRVRGQCVRCGYDVRGSRARCPECGEVITPYVRPGSRGA